MCVQFFCFVCCVLLLYCCCLFSNSVFCSENYACQALIFSGFALFLSNFKCDSFHRNEVTQVFVLFCFSCFISLKSGKCFIDHCLPALFLQTLNPRFRAFVGVFFASPRKSLTLPICLSSTSLCFPRLDPFSSDLSKNAGVEVSFLAENEKTKTITKTKCGGRGFVQLLCSWELFSFFVLLDRFRPFVRPCPDYVLTKNAQVYVTSSSLVVRSPAPAASGIEPARSVLGVSVVALI